MSPSRRVLREGPGRFGPGSCKPIERLGGTSCKFDSEPMRVCGQLCRETVQILVARMTQLSQQLDLRCPPTLDVGVGISFPSGALDCRIRDETLVLSLFACLAYGMTMQMKDRMSWLTRKGGYLYGPSESEAEKVGFYLTYRMYITRGRRGKPQHRASVNLHYTWRQVEQHMEGLKEASSSH